MYLVKSFRPIFICSLLFFISISLFASNNPIPVKTNKKFTSQFENVMGTSFEMVIKNASDKQGTKAETIALQEINRLSRILSSYDTKSEFNQFLATQKTAFKASPELIEVLSLFENWKASTNGALNPAFEVINQVWKKAAKNNALPTSEDLQEAVKKAEGIQYSINKEEGTITHLTNTPLAINTFVKSYIIDKAAKKVMDETGINNIVINVGGDIAVYGSENEHIAVVNPKANAINDASLVDVNVKNKFVATSGNYRRGNLIEGKWYSHIIDPRNGQPVEEVISATVIGDNATDAGALATSFNILTIKESIELAKQYPTAAYLIITKNGEQIKSDNWEQYALATTPNVAPLAAAKKDTWDPNYELTVNLELAQMQGPARRPFAAIWIEDKDKTPLRTISLWFNKPRWLHDLRAWYSANYAKYNVESGTINSISSATRTPGKYAIKWDGKDDKGEFVKTGNYTINIEVVREHGTYQIITQEIKVNNKESKIELAANTEVASASIEIKKKLNE
jgi:thiamine biosynthesis lipoprotein ApbE